ncbi:MAG TPA: hypothetical protein VNH64_00080, partial [Parvularculaceae bacterium]|nr:hypothetical protein [Parvularculaceae bacterium]
APSKSAPQTNGAPSNVNDLLKSLGADKTDQNAPKTGQDVLNAIPEAPASGASPASASQPASPNAAPASSQAPASDSNAPATSGDKNAPSGDSGQDKKPQ